ncbi:MAG: glycosyltransferase family 2 protein [Candidatus Omnitrophota bacterium]|nr:MAG: glycosyltransferase family 2 protein [Candidatus Omnitrophota bacterium]
MKLSIIIPAYNEINTIGEIIRRVKSVEFNKEIIVVDDASVDGTRDMLRKLNEKNIKVLFNEVNKGKGYAIRKALGEVSGDIVIIQDADLEYYPDEYGILIEKISQGKADVVFGTRFMGSHRAFLFNHYLGNKVLNLIANVLLNAYVTDLMSCYKVFKTDVIKSLTLKADRFGIEPEITAEVFKRKYRVYEVPISYDGRTYEEGKKIKWADFFVCVYWLIRAVARRSNTARDLRRKNSKEKSK